MDKEPIPSMTTLQAVKQYIKECTLGQQESLAPLLATYSIKGEPMNLRAHFQMYPMFKLKRPKTQTWRCARQVSKSFSICAMGSLLSGFIPNFNILYVQPRFDQIKRLNNTVMRPLLKSNIFQEDILDGENLRALGIKHFNNNSIMYMDFAFLSAERMRGISGCSINYLDEAQDLAYEHLPIIRETMSADIKYGYTMNTGTPKTTDNTLSLLYDAGSGGHWAIRCGCGKTNICAEDQDIFRMIGSNTIICAKCLGGEETTLIKYKDNIRTISFSELWESSLGARYDWSDGTPKKVFTDLQIWDKQGWTELQQLTYGRETMIRQLSGPRLLEATHDHPLMIEGDCVEVKKSKGQLLTLCTVLPESQTAVSGYDVVLTHTLCICPFCRSTDTVSVGGGSSLKGLKTRVRCKACANTHTRYSPLPKKTVKVPGYLIGMFLTDGSIELKKGQPVGINFYQKEGPIYLRIKKELEQWGLPVADDIRNSKHGFKTTGVNRSLRVYDTSLAAWFAQLGTHKRYKTFPSDFYNWDRSFAEEVLAGVVDGDGTTHHDEYNVRLCSARLIKDIGWLLTKLNIHYTSWLDKRKGKLLNLYGVRFKSKLPAIKQLKKQDYCHTQRPIVKQVYTTRIPRRTYDVTTTSGTLFVNGVLVHNCGKTLDTRLGFWVHARPELRNSHESYHVSQVTHPYHCAIPEKWQDLLDKMEGPSAYGKVKVYNEVFGIPCDESVNLLALEDIKRASNGFDNDYEKARAMCANYDLRVLGVDWSGGGALGHSFTAGAICGSRPGCDTIDTIYKFRLPLGMKPEEEAQLLARYFEDFKCSFFAHDYTGAGYLREVFMAQNGVLPDKLIPFTYAVSPRKDVISRHMPADGSRASFILDKPRSLALMISLIKHGKITLPAMKIGHSILQDLLSLIEDPREMDRGNILYLISKKANKSDDFAHGLNFATSAIWYARGGYPQITDLSRYQASPEIANEADPQWSTKKQRA